MLPQITKNNHFEFESVQREKTRQFYVKIGVPATCSFNPIRQSATDAQFFYDSTKTKTITLCLSGGIDSEAMARAFLAAKIPFKVVFLRFMNEFNLFDIKTNVEFCHANNIRYSFVDIDIIHFFESGKFFDAAQKYECQSPQITSHLWLLDQIDEVPCMSGNPMAPIWHNQKWFFVGLPGELHSAYFKYFLINKREGVPWFFMYSPELINSFFKLTCMYPYLNKEITQLGHYTYLEKCKSYQEGGFNVLPRENKFTGFELVRKYYDHKCGTENGSGFDNLFRKPLEKVFSYPDEYFQLIPKKYFDSLKR